MTLPAASTAPSHRFGWGRALRVSIAVATLGYLVWLVGTHRRDISRALFRVQLAQTRWLVAAVVLEVLAQTCTVLVQRRLLRRAGADFGRVATVRLVLAQNAITMAVPAGQAAASLFSYRHIRRRGTTSSAALWVVAASNVTTMLAIATFGAFTATGLSWLTAVTGTALVTVAWVVVTLARSPGRLRRPLRRVTAAADRVRRRPADQASVAVRVEERIERLSAVHMSWRDWGYVALFALAAVAADCAVWFSATQAVIVLPAACSAGGAAAIGRLASRCASFHAPTFAALLSAYSAGQAGLQLPIPFGLGAVESFMTAALTASKVQAIPALAAVLLYRAFSLWSVVALGTASWWHLRRRATA